MQCRGGLECFLGNKIKIFRWEIVHSEANLGYILLLQFGRCTRGCANTYFHFCGMGRWGVGWQKEGGDVHPLDPRCNCWTWIYIWRVWSTWCSSTNNIQVSIVRISAVLAFNRSIFCWAKFLLCCKNKFSSNLPEFHISLYILTLSSYYCIW